MSGPSGKSAAAVALIVATVACTAGWTAGRLSPVTVAPDSYRERDDDLVRACRAIVGDVQPFVFVVLVLHPVDPPPDRLMALVHRAVGAAVLSADTGTAVRMDSQVALIVAGSTGAVAALMDADESSAVWDPMSHYFWLVPAVNRSDVRSLFRAAWRRRSLVNVALVANSVAYTYNPFNDTLTARPVDADVLRDECRHKMDDLHGHPVRVCMFPTPNALRQQDGTYGGTDGLVASTLSKHMNFTPIYNEPTDGRNYGWAENISEVEFRYTGLLGDLVHNRADLTFNSVFLNKYHHNNTLRYTVPVLFDELCFVSPIAQQMSQWRAVFTAFDVRLWYCLAATFVVALSTWTLIKRTTDRPLNIDTLALYLFQMFLMVPLNRLPNNVPERLMVVSIVLFGFITATSLQAVMVKYLSYPMYERNMATPQDVYDSGMPILVASNNLILMFGSDEESLFVKLSDRFSISKSIDILMEVAQKRSSIAMGRKNDLVTIIPRTYVSNNRMLLHIVDACPRTFHFIYLVRRNLPFMDAINRIITTFVETGIVNHWFTHGQLYRPISEYHHPKESHEVFTMKNVVIAFLFLMAGLAISGVVFVAEIVYYRRHAGSRATPPGTRYPRRPLLVRWF